MSQAMERDQSEPLLQCRVCRDTGALGVSTLEEKIDRHLIRSNFVDSYSPILLYRDRPSFETQQSYSFLSPVQLRTETLLLSVFFSDFDGAQRAVCSGYQFAPRSDADGKEAVRKKVLARYVDLTNTLLGFKPFAHSVKGDLIWDAPWGYASIYEDVRGFCEVNWRVQIRFVRWVDFTAQNGLPAR
jgi:hypothetical protein